MKALLTYKEFCNEGISYDMLKNSIDLRETEFSEFLYGKEPNRKIIAMLNSFLKKGKDKYNIKNLITFHGTSSEFNILESGLLPTTNNRKKSLQSQPGYVYLSIFPEMAKQFGALAYPNKNITVYKVAVPLIHALADLDQLRNVRLYKKIEVGTSLAESILYGHGIRVKGKIYPYQLEVYKDNSLK